MEKLEEISKRAQTGLDNQHKNDHLDHFGKYIVSMLRNIKNTSECLSLQQKIINVIMEAQGVFQSPPQISIIDVATSDSVSGHNQHRPSSSDTPKSSTFSLSSGYQVSEACGDENVYFVG